MATFTQSEQLNSITPRLDIFRAGFCHLQMFGQVFFCNIGKTVGS